MHDFTVSGVKFEAARPKQIQAGLLGHVRFHLGDALTISAVAVRRGPDGRTVLVWPTIALERGAVLAVSMLSDAMRARVERQVCEALGLTPEAPPPSKAEPPPARGPAAAPDTAFDRRAQAWRRR